MNNNNVVNEGDVQLLRGPIKLPHVITKGFIKLPTGGHQATHIVIGVICLVFFFSIFRRFTGLFALLGILFPLHTGAQSTKLLLTLACGDHQEGPVLLGHEGLHR